MNSKGLTLLSVLLHECRRQLYLFTSTNKAAPYSIGIPMLSEAQLWVCRAECREEEECPARNTTQSPLFLSVSTKARKYSAPGCWVVRSPVMRFTNSRLVVSVSTTFHVGGRGVFRMSDKIYLNSWVAKKGRVRASEVSWCTKTCFCAAQNLSCRRGISGFEVAAQIHATFQAYLTLFGNDFLWYQRSAQYLRSKVMGLLCFFNPESCRILIDWTSLSSSWAPTARCPLNTVLRCSTLFVKTADKEIYIYIRTRSLTVNGVLTAHRPRAAPLQLPLTALLVGSTSLREILLERASSLLSETNLRPWSISKVFAFVGVSSITQTTEGALCPWFPIIRWTAKPNLTVLL